MSKPQGTMGWQVGERRPQMFPSVAEVPQNPRRRQGTGAGDFPGLARPPHQQARNQAQRAWGRHSWEPPPGVGEDQEQVRVTFFLLPCRWRGTPIILKAQ